MKKILLIGGRSNERPDQISMSHFEAYLKKLLGTRAQYYVAYLDDLEFILAPGLFQIVDTRNNIDLKEIDVVHIRGMRARLPNSDAYYLSQYCEREGIPCVTDYTRYFPPGKIAQTILFLKHGVPFLKTLYSLDMKRLIKLAEKELGYPYVLKTTVGSHGDSNYLIHGRHEAEQALTIEPDTVFMAQQYCPNDYDYRLLLAGEQHLLFERHGEAGSYLNNTSKGGAGVEAPSALPAALIRQARAVADDLGLMIAGVDIIPDRATGQLYFLEVNLQPQLRTGALLDRKEDLMQHFFGHLIDS